MANRYLPLALFGLPLCAACSVSSYQPSRTTFDVESAKEINDDDVRKAFEARPQLSRPLRIAFYTLDTSKSDDIERTLRAVKGVSDVYRISPILVSGQRRFQDSRHYPTPPTQELSLKKLRLIAARARADMVAVFDYGYRLESSPNVWVAITPLLIPTLFVPFLDRKLESYLDTYLVDTRNGYLYAHISAEEKVTIPSTNIYHDAGPTITATWQKMLSTTQEHISALASNTPVATVADVTRTTPRTTAPSVPSSRPGEVPLQPKP